MSQKSPSVLEFASHDSSLTNENIAGHMAGLFVVVVVVVVAVFAVFEVVAVFEVKPKLKFTDYLTPNMKH